MEPVFGLLILAAPLYMTFKKPKIMYWVCLANLWFQGLIILFKFDQIVNLHGLGEIQPALFLCFLTFFIPFVCAFFTGTFLQDPLIGVACIPIYCIVQTVILGIQTNQEAMTHRVITGIKYFLPVLATIVSAARIVAMFLK